VVEYTRTKESTICVDVDKLLNTQGTKESTLSDNVNKWLMIQGAKESTITVNIEVTVCSYCP